MPKGELIMEREKKNQPSLFGNTHTYVQAHICVMDFYLMDVH